MPYGDEFKAKVLEDLRRSGDFVSVVAGRHGVAHSTVVRWREAETAAPNGGPETVEEDLLERLGRNDTRTRDWLSARVNRHIRSVRIYNAAATGVAAVWFMVFVVVPVSLVAVAVSESDFPRWTMSQDFGALSAYVLVVWAILMVLDWLMARAFAIAGPFTYATTALASCRELLRAPGSSGIFDDPWYHIPSRRKRRALRRNLRVAEKSLSRRTVLGRSYRTQGAREWELGCRRRIAATLAYIEIALELEGSSAFQRVLELLDEIMSLTLLRDWSLDDMPTMEAAPSHYQTPLARLLAIVWRPVPALGILLGLIAASQPLIDLIRRVGD